MRIPVAALSKTYVCGPTLARIAGSNHAVARYVAQLVETLRYTPEGRGFDSRWRHCNFSLT
jgi:hypothetical protein